MYHTAKNAEIIITDVFAKWFLYSSVNGLFSIIVLIRLLKTWSITEYFREYSLATKPNNNPHIKAYIPWIIFPWYMAKSNEEMTIANSFPYFSRGFNTTPLNNISSITGAITIIKIRDNGLLPFMVLK